MLETIRSSAIVGFHDAALRLEGWPERPEAAAALTPAAEPWPQVVANHRFNCALWDEEDLARRRQAADADIALNKRRIDGFNQARNDAIERIDDAILRATESLPRAEDARLSSETAGAMIDRMSILSLKIHHMGLQLVRDDVDDAHRASCSGRLQQLQRQRADLAGCYDRLLDEVAAGTGFFRIYRQFKMYNDPNLNPVLVAERRSAGGA